ncbi:MAG TPA: ATP synthase archaeal subunit H [Methanosarcinales archaeon]|nr:ATP synthase archaeal subunit H [Methanosarcinales archaeon]
MSESEILERIKQAESDARAMIAQAYEDKRKAIADAKTEAREILSSAEERAKDHASRLMDAEKGKISEERRTILQKGEADAKKMKNAASGRIDAAVDFLLAEFERTVHAKAKADE